MTKALTQRPASCHLDGMPEPDPASPPLKPDAERPGWAVIDLRGAHRPRAAATAGPLAQVCGLPVLVRNLLLLQRGGWRTALLLCEPADRIPVEQTLAREPRLLRFRVLWGESDENLRHLLQAQDHIPTEILYWPGALSFGRRLPRLATAHLSDETRALLPICSDGPAPGPFLIAVSELLAASPSAGGLAELVKQASAFEGGAQRFPLEHRARLLLDVAAVAEAESALLRSLRKAADGAVARFDRYISLALSRRLMRLPVTPNQITAIGGLLGISCGLLASVGGYAPMLIAALGFQLNSITDGIDGEIARAKLLESRLGQWLDTLADDSSNLFYAVGVCVGCYRTYGSSIYLGLAAVVGSGLIITAALMYRYIITVAHSGDLNDFKMPWEEMAAARAEQSPGTIPVAPTGLAAQLARLKFIIRRDTFVFLSTCLAILGQLRVMAWLFAAGATAVWLSIVGYRVIWPALRSHAE